MYCSLLKRTATNKILRGTKERVSPLLMLLDELSCVPKLIHYSLRLNILVDKEIPLIHIYIYKTINYFQLQNHERFHLIILINFIVFFYYTIRVIEKYMWLC